MNRTELSAWLSEAEWCPAHVFNDRDVPYIHFNYSFTTYFGGDEKNITQAVKVYKDGRVEITTTGSSDGYNQPISTNAMQHLARIASEMIHDFDWGI